MGKSNMVEITPVGNSVSVANVGNQIDVSVFSVTSIYYLLTQFQPFRHDEKVGVPS